MPCRVYERVDALREIGAGITLLPHATRELAELGLEQELLEAGVENRTSLFFNRFGQKLYEENRGRLAGYIHPEIGIHRGKLHSILLNAVRDRIGADNLLPGHTFVELEQAGGRVIARFATASGSSESVESDGLIACDGVNSAVRAQFYPGEALQFGGINTWRGISLFPPILSGRDYLRIGSIKTGKLVIYPISAVDPQRNLQRINWVAEIEERGASLNDWNRTTDISRIESIYRDWKFEWLDVPALLGAAESVLEYPMVDRDPVSAWTFGSVTLAGDAAHPMYPRGSNGAAQSLIDARVLADALAAEHSVPDAFRSYEAQRRSAVNRIVLTNRHTPPDYINVKVEELVGDRPFDNLDRYISQDELKKISAAYRDVAGFTADRVH